MRTIKFRGKRLLSNDWEYGNLIQRPDGGHFIETGDLRLCPMQDFSIGQYTGLIDKNGKEIYEGDIVKTEGNWGGVVTWNSRGYYYVKDQYYSDDEEPDLSPLGSLHCYERKKLEIISNIHDNPELLKNND